MCLAVPAIYAPNQSETCLDSNVFLLLLFQQRRIMQPFKVPLLEICNASVF